MLVRFLVIMNFFSNGEFVCPMLVRQHNLNVIEAINNAFSARNFDPGERISVHSSKNQGSDLI